MSKIEEMALEAYPDNKVRLQKVCYGEIQRQAYIKGAKAVLEEIEKYISELPCKSDGELVNQKMLWQRVKQLKG